MHVEDAIGSEQYVTL